jgi:hypothetical protein
MRRRRQSKPALELRGLEPVECEIVERSRPHTMTSDVRLVAAMDAAAHVVRRGLPGAVVECGVWRGGSVLAMVLRMQSMGVTDRDVWLYDTFTGMTAPTDQDTSPYTEPATATWERARATGRTAWDSVFGADAFDLDAVRGLLLTTGYPPDRLHFVVGPVEETVPAEAPTSIGLLRLDTDWYESTRHELVHLYPRLVTGGVLIVDDYGHWDGCRLAVDEYFAAEADPILLSRIDYTGRIGVKS